MDFRKHLKPETKEALEQRERIHARRVQEAAAMPNAKLVEHVERTLAQCSVLPHEQKGEPTYEATLRNVLIPELLRRLRGSSRGRFDL